LETVWVRTLLDYSALAKIVSKFFCHSQNLWVWSRIFKFA
jgi:hypothetical protein